MEENNIMMETIEVEVPVEESTDVIETEGKAKSGLGIGLAAVALGGVAIGLGKKFIAPHFSKEARRDRLENKLAKLEAEIAAEEEFADMYAEEDQGKKFNPKGFLKKMKKEPEED